MFKNNPYLCNQLETKTYYLMKKTRLSFLFVGLFSLVAMTSCSSNEEDNVNNKNVIQPINVTNSPVETFFSTELPELHQRSGDTGGTKSFFYNPDLYGGENIYKNIICVINSRQELSDIYLGEKELPEIDFDNYTLILGQQIMPYLGFYVGKKELVKGEDALILNLHARHDSRSDENLPTMLQILYFWGLYPKQIQKNITVNVIKEFPNR